MTPWIGELLLACIVLCKYITVHKNLFKISGLVLVLGARNNASSIVDTVVQTSDMIMHVDNLFCFSDTKVLADRTCTTRPVHVPSRLTVVMRRYGATGRVAYTACTVGRVRESRVMQRYEADILVSDKILSLVQQFYNFTLWRTFVHLSQSSTPLPRRRGVGTVGE